MVKKQNPALFFLFALFSAFFLRFGCRDLGKWGSQSRFTTNPADSAPNHPTSNERNFLVWSWLNIDGFRFLVDLATQNLPGKSIGFCPINQSCFTTTNFPTNESRFTTKPTDSNHQTSQPGKLLPIGQHRTDRFATCQELIFQGNAMGFSSHPTREANRSAINQIQPTSKPNQGS